MKVLACIIIVAFSAVLGILVAYIKDRYIRVGLTTLFVSLALNLFAREIGII